MKAMFHDIAEQFQHCAVLMSDPEVIRFQSGRIATQFNITANRVENLKLYLERPKDLKEEKPWFDKHIIGGIDRLVEQTLKRHLKPLYKEFKFPLIFEEGAELYEEGRGTDPASIERSSKENLVVREIKETNCMGAMVLLQYYLHWHIMLIRMNMFYHPSAYWRFKSDKDDGGFVDFAEDLFDKLPTSDDLLERRRFGGVMKTQGQAQIITAARVGILKDYMIDKGELTALEFPNVRRRHTNTVRAYERVLYTCNVRNYSKARGGQAPPHPRKQIILKDDDIDTYAFLDCIDSCAIRAHLSLSGGVLSTFTLQDDISKWDDMYRPIEVQSNSEDSNAKSTSVYSYRLVDVLKCPPYSTNEEGFKVYARESAVYDYGSVPLMMKISKSLIKLAHTTDSRYDPTEMFSHLMYFLWQHVDHNQESLKSALLAYKTASNGIGKDQTAHHKTKFIQLTSNFWRPVSNIATDLTDTYDNAGFTSKCMIDDIAGDYWGSRPSGLADCDHRYMACPSLELDPRIGPKTLNLFQALCNLKAQNRKKTDDIIVRYLIRLQRSSLFVSNAISSVIRLLDEFRTFEIEHEIQLFDTRSGAIFPSRVMNILDTVAFGSVIGEEDILSLNTDETLPNPQITTRVSITTLRKEFQRELAALQSCVDHAKTIEFQKYPGISWPVRFGVDNTVNNFQCFEYVRSMPVVAKSLQDSASEVASVLGTFSDSLITIGRSTTALTENVEAINTGIQAVVQTLPTLAPHPQQPAPAAPAQLAPAAPAQPAAAGP